ncbi:hypothetical protein GCM10010191_17180 [Actinomadura vinacea]|uniref:Ankyrin repeat domain-containing protein n=1 Tax=Actinomadura vinacea TaxID=115336 RepID=A0ABN3IN38_9ACTN
MARKKYPHHPVRDRFLRDLLALHQACGSPAYSLIVKTSARLEQTYPVPGGVASLPPLSKTALSETLNGHRKGLPDHGFVATFVLSCYRIAHEQGIIADDPGRDALPRWQEMLREAEEEAERLGLAQRRRPAGPRGPSAASSRTGAAPARLVFPDAPPPSPEPDGYGTADGPVPQGGGLTGPILLTAVQHDVLAAHGPVGSALVRRVQARDPHAVYQAAVLIAAAPGRDEDAISLLTVAAAAGHPDALELLQASPRELDRPTAALHADDLARAAYTTGHPRAARVFATCAEALRSADDARPAGDRPGRVAAPDVAST